MLFVYFNRDALAVVQDRDQVLLGVYLHLYQIHSLVPLKVIRGVHEYLVEDLVESRDVLDHSLTEFRARPVVDPKHLPIVLYTSNVSVRSKQNVLELCLLLVDLLNRRLHAYLEFYFLT